MFKEQSWREQAKIDFSEFNSLLVVPKIYCCCCINIRLGTWMIQIFLICVMVALFISICSVIGLIVTLSETNKIDKVVKGANLLNSYTGDDIENIVQE